MIQVKRHLKNAAWFAVGITLGGAVLPRLFFSDQFTGAEPSLWSQCLLYFGVAFAFAFVAFCGAEWFRARSGK